MALIVRQRESLKIMQTCKTCKHWKKFEEDYVPPDYQIRRCKNPKMEHNECPLKNTASPHDYDGYEADFITGEDFGCVLHEPI